MTLPLGTTGSDGSGGAICYVDGKTAHETYGVAIRTATMCPNCKFPLSVTLSFNPTTSYYAIAPCPVCGKFIEYCDINGDLVKKFTFISSTKNTPVDNDIDFPNNWI